MRGVAAVVAGVLVAVGVGIAALSAFEPVTPGATTELAAQHLGVVSVHRFLPVATLQLLDCPSATNCVAYDGTSLIDVRDAGRIWRRSSLPSVAASSPHITGLSCTSASTCWAAGTSTTHGGAYLLRTSDGGLSWHRDALPRHAGALEAISCPAEQWCMTLAQQGDGVSALVTANGGGTWTRRAVPEDLDDATLSCGAPRWCIVGAERDGSTEIVIGTSDGTSWQTLRRMRAGTVAFGVPSSIEQVLCSSRTVCFVAQSDGLLRTSNAGKSWRSLALPKGYSAVDGLGLSRPGGFFDCVSASDSVVADGSGMATTSDGGQHWQIHKLRASGVIAPGAASLVSCSGVGACAVASSLANVVALYAPSTVERPSRSARRQRTSLPMPLSASSAPA